jgi:hypothetical protein
VNAFNHADPQPAVSRQSMFARNNFQIEHV